MPNSFSGLHFEKIKHSPLSSFTSFLICLKGVSDVHNPVEKPVEKPVHKPVEKPVRHASCATHQNPKTA